MSREKITEFFTAIDVQNWDLVVGLLKDQPSLSHVTDDSEDYYGWSGLHRVVNVAMESGVDREKIFKLVSVFRTVELNINPKPDISVVNFPTPQLQDVEYYGLTPAHLAAMHGDEEMLELLMKPATKDTSSDSHSDSESPLDGQVSNLWLLTQDRETVMHLVVDKGLDDFFVKHQEEFFQSYNTSDSSFSLEEDNANRKNSVNFTTEGEQTLLMVAAYRARLKIVKELLEQKSLDFDLVDINGRNFLHYLCLGNHQDNALKSARRKILKTYLDHLGEDKTQFFRLLSSQDVNNNTPLDYAYSENKDPKLTQMLENTISDNINGLNKVYEDASEHMAQTHLHLWYELLQKSFIKNATTAKNAANNNRVQRITYHTRVLQDELKRDPQNLDAINTWVSNTKDDLHSQVLSDRWKMLLVTLLFMAIFGALGFATTLSCLNASTWLAVNSLAELSQHLWVLPGFQTILLASCSTASAVVGAALGAVLSSQVFFFKEKKVADLMISELSIAGSFEKV